MSVEIQYKPNNICLLRISGVLKRTEFGAGQSASGKISMLARSRACSPFSKTSRAGNAVPIGTIWILFSRTGTRSRKIAIAGEPRWESGATGLRRNWIPLFKNYLRSSLWIVLVAAGRGPELDLLDPNSSRGSATFSRDTSHSLASRIRQGLGGSTDTNAPKWGT